MVVLWKKPDWASLVVDGPDAADWLNGLVTCDVASVKPGQGAWGSLLTKQGKVQGDLQIIGEGTHLVLGVSGGEASDIAATLDGYLVMEDAELTPSPLAWVLAAGQGAQDALRQKGLPAERLPWGGVPVFASTVTNQQLALFDDVPWAPADAWERLRIENGWFRFGVDYGEKDNLHAASLERRTVDWQKGCYLGQEVVCMQDMRGRAKRRLVVGRLVAGELPGVGEELSVSSAEESAASTGNSGRKALVKSARGESLVLSVQAPFDAPETRFVGSASEVVVRALP